jgi:hypothetical protein
MLPTPTHLASGSVIVHLDDLSPEDLAHLLWVKRTEADRLRERDARALERSVRRWIAKMPEAVAASITAQLDAGCSAAVVVAESWDAFFVARFGGGSVAALGSYVG